MNKRELAYELETLGLQIDKLYEFFDKGLSHEALKQYVFISQRIIQLREDLK